MGTIYADSTVTPYSEEFSVDYAFKYLGTILTVFGFFFLFGGFWSGQQILWNRTPYTIGQWINSNPILAEKLVQDLKPELFIAFSALFFGSILYLIGILILGYSFYKTKPFSIRSWSFLTLSTTFTSLIGFWIYISMNLKTDLPTNPTAWLGNDLPEMKFLFELVGLLNLIIHMIITLIYALYLIYSIFKIKRAEETKRKVAKQVQVTNPLHLFGFYFVMALYLLITLIPVFLTLIVSMSSPSDLEKYRQVGNRDFFPFPTNIIYSMAINYSSVLFVQKSTTDPSFTSAFFISLFLGLGTASIGLVMSLTSAYALARFRFYGRAKFTFSLVAIQMFPGIILLIPQFLIWTHLGLLDKDIRIFGVLLALTVGAIGYSTWMMKGYFETLPKDLEEASLIDGANVFTTFYNIAIPLAKPGMVAVFLFTFLGAWNDFLLVRTFIGENRPDSTLSLLFYNYQDTTRSDLPVFYELVASYSILMGLPVALIFMALQKYLAAGATAGAIK
ncbi:MAG: carbohydrate ABC transporter permease [Candidatus Hodarchaeales archaeon]|jgi:arabinogalactan oligomer/maltooligosaccharide transport system permease protein